MSETRPISSIAKIRRGASPRPIGDPRYFGGSVGWVRIVDVTRSSRFLQTTEEYLSPLGESLSVRVKRGDLIMSICGTIGRPIIVDMDACIHDGFVQFYDLKDVDSVFFYYELQFSESAFIGMGQPGTQTNLNTAIAGRHRIYCPSLATQKKIATILTAIDTTIEKTEALIDKYRQIKAGLMHDLFTRGVLPNGQLRPPRGEAPELYQETAIGWIPKEWEAKSLRTACTWYSGGTPSKRNKEWWNGTLPWLSPKDMKHFELIDTEDHVTRQAAMFGSRVVPQGSVFIVVRGMILAHSFPVVLSGAEFAFNQDVKAIIAHPPMNNRYLAYWFVANTDLFLKKTTESTHGTKRFDLNDLYKIEIGVPSESEQQRVIDRLNTVEDRLGSEYCHLDKLRVQKLGLMQDLLTGKVPVTPQETEIRHA